MGGRSRTPTCADRPVRWSCTCRGSDAVEGIDQKARLLLAQIDAHRALSTNLAHDDAHAVA
jgi:hypothetical protein